MNRYHPWYHPWIDTALEGCLYSLDWTTGLDWTGLDYQTDLLPLKIIFTSRVASYIILACLLPPTALLSTNGRSQPLQRTNVILERLLLCLCLHVAPLHANIEPLLLLRMSGYW